MKHTKAGRLTSGTRPAGALGPAPTNDWAGWIFSISVAGLGLLSLLFHDFNYVWQPVPAWIPWQAGLAMASGGLLVALGVAMWFRRAAATAALALAAYLLLSCLLLHGPMAVAAPRQLLNWGALGELAGFLVGGWILAIGWGADASRLRLPGVTGASALRPARILFGLGLLPFGLEHLRYVVYTASLVPAWLPARTAWAYATGAAHIAAGVAILLGIWPRRAANLWAAMIGLFTLLVWVPRLAAVPTLRSNWSEFLVSAGFAAAGWIVASSYAARGGRAALPAGKIGAKG